VNSCNEIYELLSASYDSELNDSDEKIVREHLATCPECLALLEIFREISSGVQGSVTSAPDSLRENVMREINKASKPHEERSVFLKRKNSKIGDIKSNVRSSAHIKLRRFAFPLAACLAVALLAIPVLMMQQNADDTPEFALFLAEYADISPAAVDMCPDFDDLPEFPESEVAESRIRAAGVTPGVPGGDVFWGLDETDDYEHLERGFVDWDYGDWADRASPAETFGAAEYEEDIALENQHVLHFYYAHVKLTGSELPTTLANIELETVYFTRNFAFRITLDDFNRLIDFEPHRISEVIFGNEHSEYVIVELGD
jgi:hypothetical protein